MATSFEDLKVFKLAYKVSLEIHKATLDFPKFEQFVMADQLRRSSRSICANIVEGFAKQIQSKTHFSKYLVDALGSSDETRMWLRYCLDLGYIKKEQWQNWRNQYQEISKMLTGLIKRLKT